MAVALPAAPGLARPPSPPREALAAPPLLPCARWCVAPLRPRVLAGNASGTASEALLERMAEPWRACVTPDRLNCDGSAPLRPVDGPPGRSPRATGAPPPPSLSLSLRPPSGRCDAGGAVGSAGLQLKERKRRTRRPASFSSFHSTSSRSISSSSSTAASLRMDWSSSATSERDTPASDLVFTDLTFSLSLEAAAAPPRKHLTASTVPSRAAPIARPISQLPFVGVWPDIGKLEPIMTFTPLVLELSSRSGLAPTVSARQCTFMKSSSELVSRGPM
mmetsp:Transcript_4161/g.10434  ORF Transcript_4161/g.10434 Transcript_4161/m.10434 type:complete len:276 (+) Transcript_4161:713-1540(+)